jgi:hypothetical protein
VATRPTAPSGYAPSKHSDINNTQCSSHLDAAALRIIATRRARPASLRDQAELFGQVALDPTLWRALSEIGQTQRRAASGVTRCGLCRLRQRETGGPLAVLPQPHTPGQPPPVDHL